MGRQKVAKTKKRLQNIFEGISGSKIFQIMEQKIKSSQNLKKITIYCRCIQKCGI